jgi:hypothetical protein
MHELVNVSQRTQKTLVVGREPSNRSNAEIRYALDTAILISHQGHNRIALGENHTDNSSARGEREGYQ